MPSLRSFSIPIEARKPSILLTQASLEESNSQKYGTYNFSMNSDSSGWLSDSSFYPNVPKSSRTHFPFSSSTNCFTDPAGYVPNPQKYGGSENSLIGSPSNSIKKREKQDSCRQRTIMTQVVDTWASVSDPQSPLSLGSASGNRV